MKIAIDCRYLGGSGIGRVCEGILDNLDYSENEYYLVGDLQKLKKYERAVLIEDHTSPFSKKGLFRFQKKRINKECDCIIIPNFIIPMGIKIPVHSVMHDLIFLDRRETVNGKLDYLIKKTLLKRCMKKSKSVACVSGFTKSRCEYYYKKYAHKCYVNYNGLSADIMEYGASHPTAEKTDTLVFVGNVKPHKGLKTLLSAFSRLGGDTKLKIIGEREGFHTGLKLDDSAYENVEFTGKLCGEELYLEIQSAKYLVQPSVYEGFGLPPLEALYLGTQPILSDIEVFREIYSAFPVKFFNGEEELTNVMRSESTAADCRNQILETYHFKNFAANLLSKIV